MNNFYKSTAIILLLLPLSMTSMAAESQTANPMNEMGMHHGAGMTGGMTEEQQTEHARATQEHLLQMHDLSNQILAEKDPAKKAALKKQQLDLMKAHHGQIMDHHRQKMLEQKDK